MSKLRGLRWTLGAGFVAMCGLGLGACDGGPGVQGTAGHGGHGGTGQGASGAGSATGGNGGSGAGVVADCDPPCVEPQLCSVEKVCIDAGTCLGDGDCEAGKICDEPTATCVPGGGCGAKEVVADPIPPNILIVLDRSCSMTADVAGAGMTKWEIAVAALNTMTTTFAGKIRFGLTLFPDKVAPSCGQDVIPVPVGDGNEMAIQAMLTAALANADPLFPDGPCVTNIDTAMEQAAGEPAWDDGVHAGYALLITDGKQAGCNLAGGDNGTTQIIQDLHDTKMVSTFVLGFGSGIDPAQMNLFAEAGGVPAGPDTKYYDAADQASLDAALATIAKKTIGCSFSLDEAPPNPDEVFVFFDNVDSVPNDKTHMEGWDYDAGTNQVTFYGMACEKLKSGEVTDVDIVFGCNEPTPN